MARQSITIAIRLAAIAMDTWMQLDDINISNELTSVCCIIQPFDSIDPAFSHTLQFNGGQYKEIEAIQTKQCAPSIPNCN